MKAVLSIDGGGIRGLIPALVLARIEELTGKPVAELFQLVAGTSTGGLLALALCRDQGDGKPLHRAADLVELYEEQGPAIFDRSLWRDVRTLGGLVDERYSAEALEQVLFQYLGDVPLGAALGPVLVSSYEIQSRSTYFFKSWKEEQAKILMRHAARATSAAPTYFEPTLVSVEGRELALVDGGVFANNPAMCAYAEARKLWADEPELLVVSLGTGELTRPLPYGDARGWGLAEWAAPLLGVIFDGVSDAVDYQLRHILGPEHFIRFQTRLERASDDLDDTSADNLEALRAEAATLLTSHQGELERLTELLAG